MKNTSETAADRGRPSAFPGVECGILPGRSIPQATIDAFGALQARLMEGTESAADRRGCTLAVLTNRALEAFVATENKRLDRNAARRRAKPRRSRKAKAEAAEQEVAG